MKKRAVAILGGTGYGAGELLRYLTFHPAVEVTQVISSSSVGERVTKAHPHLSGIYDSLSFTKEIEGNDLIVFSSLPHGTSSAELLKLQERGVKGHFIDLSGDLRLRSPELHERFYGEVPFQSEFRAQFSYSIPEIHGERQRHISNPGCLATAGALALWPLRQEEFLGSVVLDAKTGTSGAGRSPQASMHHPRRHGNCEAYKVLAHRHEPEIAQTVGVSRLMFVPHLLPTSRGILVTLYGTISRAVSRDDMLQLFSAAYGRCPFIRLRDEPSSLNEVVGTNFCDISVFARENQVVVSAALDNLGKGMAGQAIQNMNLLLGLPEETGLLIPALGI